MKIAYVITRADAVGGASVHVRDLARAMLERGHEVTVLAGGEGPVVDQLHAAGVPFRSLRFLSRSIHPIRDLRAARELAEALRDFGPDLLSVHTAKAGWIGRAVASWLGLPVVYTPHGWSIADRFSPWTGFAFHLAERAATKWATVIICVCQYEKELALRKRVAAPDRLQVVYNGVHDIPAEFIANPATAPVRIVSVARFEAPKDHRTLLRALATIPTREWQLDLVGDGPLLPQTRALANELGIAAKVHFLGYQPDPARTLARAGIFALSSRSEGFPRSILEAMRAGLPVVATPVGGIPEAVRDGVNGLLATTAGLAAALTKLIDNPELRAQLGAEARRTYETRFRFTRMAEETADIYRSLLSKSP